MRIHKSLHRRQGRIDAGVKLTASDGESRLIGVGEVILVENTTGKGHLSDHVDGKIRHSLFIPIE